MNQAARPALPDSLIAPHRRGRRIGVLMVNLGTPESPTPGAIRRYLRQFLSDRRVVEVPRPIWWLILNLLILPLRPIKLAKTYGSVWHRDGSPLMVISRQQHAALKAAMGDDAVVELAMTYGEPSVGNALARLKAQDVDRLLVLPLYPQYSATTTAAVTDAVFRVLMQDRDPPALRVIRQYHDDPGYIDALARSVERHWAEHGRGDHLLCSFHGIPQRNLLRGDPYHCQAHKTARLLRERLGLDDAAMSLSFQSRLGKMPWLQPYTDQHVTQLAQRGIKKLDVICPGFAADCLETLEEVAIGYGETFTHAGGAALRYIPALNAETDHIDYLATLTRRHLQGWDASTDAATEVDQRLANVARVLPGAHIKGL
ncbi:ferrochelatase [Polycyclovorans algicola]|uniref:ferrochelatase n=1 Tax=Polycyclovorans algicola TaxID=616992 RepID=UPI0005BC00AB|nr:ferrochelatase [Polycyclovorans algicola]